MKSFAWSRLAGQHLLLGARFALRYPHDWLIWEPGAWTVPKGNISVVATAAPKTDSPRPSHGDPLCFALEGPCSVGRAEGNTLVLSDETVSRHHCLFEPRDGGWWVTRDKLGAAMKVDGAVLAPGVGVRLASNQRVELGQIVLTFATTHGLIDRMRRQR